jgi:hypothetical protein
MMQKTKSNRERTDRGISLILVLLAVLVLTTLAAAMVFSARTETLASYNYRISMQAEYAARAGVQRALNFFNNDLDYAAVNPLPEATLTAVYSFPPQCTGGTGTCPAPPGTCTGTCSTTPSSPYATNPVNLFFANTAPVQCLSGVPGCSAGPVVLGTTSGNSNYPNNTGQILLMSTSPSFNVVNNWLNDMVGQTISDGMGGTGTYTVTAKLLDYHTVNDSFFGVPATDPRCAGDPLKNSGICRLPYEVWQITSTGKWNNNIGAGIGSTVIPTVVVKATIAPMFAPYFGNAMYGLCSVTLAGSKTCTDSYNSAVGSYGGTPATTCPPTSGTGNASWSNSPVGSNGGITLNGNVQVGGNLSFADATGNSTCDSGFQGSTSGIEGNVLPGSPVPTPPLPPFSSWGYNPTVASPPTPSAQPPNGGSNDYTVSDVILDLPHNTALNPNGLWNIPALIPGYVPGLTGSGCATLSSSGGYVVTYTVKSGAVTSASCTAVPTVSSGSPSATNPYTLGNIQDANGGSAQSIINFIVPDNGLANPTVVAANSVSLGGNSVINISDETPSSVSSPFPPVVTSSPYAAVTLDVSTTVSLGSTASLNYNAASPGVPSPDTLALNVGGTSASCSSNPTVNLSGQSSLSAMINASNGSVSLSGSGSGGVFFGSILGAEICDNGNYAVHYDTSTKTQSGKLYNVQVMSVVRPKM